MLYSKDGQYPTLLPYRIRMPDGSTRTDPSSFIEEDLSLAGYIAVEEPPESISANQRLEWTGTEWNVIEIEYDDTLPDLPPL